MYNLLIAFAAGVVVTVAVRLAGLSWLAGIVPGVLGFIGAYVFLAKRIADKLKGLIYSAQKELQSTSSPRDKDAKVAKAVKTLEQGLRYDRWQIMVAPQVHGQIGILHYMMKDYPSADPTLTQVPGHARGAALPAEAVRPDDRGLREGGEGRKEGRAGLGRLRVVFTAVQGARQSHRRPRPRGPRQSERREAQGRPHRPAERQAAEDEALGADVVAVQSGGPSPGFRRRKAGTVPAAVSRRAGVSSCRFQ